MPSLIDTKKTSAWGQLVHYVGGIIKLLVQRAGERFLGPRPQAIKTHSHNKDLLHLLDLCERYKWEEAQLFVQQQTANVKKLLLFDRVYRIIKKQRINKYYITRIADQDPIWINLSIEAKKAICNNLELRNLCNAYFLARYELRLTGKNPDEYEIPILFKEGQENIVEKDNEKVEDPQAASEKNEPEQEDFQPEETLPSVETNESLSSLSDINKNVYDPYQQPPIPPQLPLPSDNLNPKENKSSDYRADNFHKLTKEQWEALIKLFREAKEKRPENFTPEELQAFIATLLADIKKIWPECPISDINWQHLTRLSLNKRKKLIGYHTTSFVIEKCITKTIEPCKHGLYKAIWTALNKTKESSMFPDHWRETKVILTILEAYLLNVKEVEATNLPNVFRVLVQAEEIAIQFYFDIVKKTITTAYPLLEGLYSCCFKLQLNK